MNLGSWPFFRFYVKIIKGMKGNFETVVGMQGLGMCISVLLMSFPSTLKRNTD